MEEVRRIIGQVVHGKGLGRTVGMPTANIEPVKPCILPKEGVYGTKVYIGGSTYTAVTNIGRRPSVDSDDQVTIEAYILDFDEDIYGETVELEVTLFLRPVQKFESLEKVQEQVQKDIEVIRKKLCN